MSDLEILKKTIDTLDGISVPVPLTEQIAIPVINARNMIKALYDAIVADLQRKAEEAKKEEPEK